MREAFKEYLKSKQFSRKSIDSRLMIINQYWKWLEQENMEAEQVDYNDLLLFMKHCQQKGRSQKTIQHYMVVARHFYEHLLREGQVPVNPASDIEVKGVKRKMLYHILQPHELHSLYNRYNDETLKGKRNKVMLGLLVYQGLQTEELAMLETSHIKLREGKIDVPGGKRSNGRTMKLEAHQVMDMYDYVLHTRPEILKESKQQTTHSNQYPTIPAFDSNSIILSQTTRIGSHTNPIAVNRRGTGIPLRVPNTTTTINIIIITRFSLVIPSTITIINIIITGFPLEIPAQLLQ